MHSPNVFWLGLWFTLALTPGLAAQHLQHAPVRPARYAPFEEAGDEESRECAVTTHENPAAVIPASCSSDVSSSCSSVPKLLIASTLHDDRGTGSTRLSNDGSCTLEGRGGIGGQHSRYESCGRYGVAAGSIMNGVRRAWGDHLYLGKACGLVCIKGCCPCSHCCCCKFPSPGDMVGHLPYDARRMYYYSRPYQSVHVQRDRDQYPHVDRNQPYSNGIFTAIHAAYGSDRKPALYLEFADVAPPLSNRLRPDRAAIEMPTQPDGRWWSPEIQDPAISLPLVPDPVTNEEILHDHAEPVEQPAAMDPFEDLDPAVPMPMPELETDGGDEGSPDVIFEDQSG